MKKMTIRKLVVSIIGLVSMSLVFLCMLCNVITITNTDGGKLNLSVNAIELLSYGFPKEMGNYLLKMCEPDFIKLWEVLFGVVSTLTLLIGIAGAICIGISFGRKKNNNYAKFTIAFVSSALALSVIYLVVAITFAVFISYGATTILRVNNVLVTTYLPTAVAFQILAFIAVLICNKKVSDKELAKREKSSVVVKTEDAFEKLIGEEETLIGILKEYFALKDEFITQEDYDYKKYKILSFMGVKLKTKQFEKLSKQNYKVVKLEPKVIVLIKEYKELLDNGAITEEDFENKRKELICLGV